MTKTLGMTQGFGDGAAQVDASRAALDRARRILSDRQNQAEDYRPELHPRQSMNPPGE
jgi:hypothetical protein